jgi:hypothetical protein
MVRKEMVLGPWRRASANQGSVEFNAASLTFLPSITDTESATY